jgi:hypothetical protein
MKVRTYLGLEGWVLGHSDKAGGVKARLDSVLFSFLSNILFSSETLLRLFLLWGRVWQNTSIVERKEKRKKSGSQ